MPVHGIVSPPKPCASQPDLIPPKRRPAPFGALAPRDPVSGLRGIEGVQADSGPQSRDCTRDAAKGPFGLFFKHLRTDPLKELCIERNEAEEKSSHFHSQVTTRLPKFMIHGAYRAIL